MPLCSSLYLENWLVHLWMSRMLYEKACMEAYENKLPQGFYNKISSYVVTMDTHMKGINMGAVTTVDIEVVFNRTLGIIGSEEFDLHDLFPHELAPIPTSLFLDDGIKRR